MKTALSSTLLAVKKYTLPQLCISLLVALTSAAIAQADNSPATPPAEQAKNNAEATDKKDSPSSPWLFTPLLSSNPKFGSSVGALGAYLHHFDEESPVSIFGLTGKYSSTHSYSAGLFSKVFFDQDKQRIIAALGLGKVENDYEDFLGTGQEAQTTDDINFIFARYLYRIAGNWFLGAQGVSTNYTSSASDLSAQEVLDLLGLGGFQSNGLGVVVNFDSRDNTRSASSGSQFLLHNIAYREALGGDESFDVYVMEYDTYLPIFNKQVTAIQLKGRWSVDAPNSAYSSVELPGYTRGEFLAENMSYVFLDQRISFTPRWGMSVSAGAACLYGRDVFDRNINCGDRANLYPSIATGAIYTLKPSAKIVIRAEIAAGKGDTSAFVLSFGQPF